MNNNTTRTSRRHNVKKHKQKSFFKQIIQILFIAILIIAVGVTILFSYYIFTAPKLDPDKLADPFVSEIYDMNDEFVTDRGGAEKRKKVSYEDLPDNLVQAVIATEDSRFFEHPGIDFRRIFGAIKANIVNGFGSEGASTITQQVVENYFLTPEKSIKLKVQEQWLAMKLEREYSKEEILEMYLNKIFYGNNAYGVAKASEIYFGKTDLHELTLIESAMLAGLPQRPTAYNPYERPDLMEGRVDTVLKLMVRHNKISQAEADEARNIDITSTLTEQKPVARLHDGFVQQVEKEIKEKLDGTDINTDGLKIYTTLDTDAQEYVEFLLSDRADNPIPYQDNDLNAGLSVVDNESGAVRAIGGNRNNENLGGMNYATELTRQAGSTMKPIAAYGPAIEYEKWSTHQQIKDETFFPKGSSNEIRNFDRRHHGTLSMREALAKSYNVPAAKTFEEIGSKRVHEFGTSIGINYASEVLDPRDSIGGTETNVTPYELAGAYSAFGNEGIYTEPYTVTRIEYPDGTIIDLTPDSNPVMEDYTAYMITDMLKTAITEGTGKNANIPGLDVVGKTGTTNLEDKAGANNAWFAGYTSKYTIAVWAGYDENNRIMPDSQTQIPLFIFKNLMADLSKDIDTPNFKKPDSVIEVDVVKGSNPPKAASPGVNSTKELFVKGTEPKTSAVAKDKSYSSVNNLSATYNESNNSINVTWSHNDSNARFDVSSAINNNSMKKVDATSNTQTTISPVEKNAKYTIQVIAIGEDGTKSKPETVSVTTNINEPTEDSQNDSKKPDDPTDTDEESPIETPEENDQENQEEPVEEPVEEPEEESKEDVDDSKEESNEQDSIDNENPEDNETKNDQNNTEESNEPVEKPTNDTTDKPTENNENKSQEPAKESPKNEDKSTSNENE